MRRLIINADDFGFTKDVNAGIVAAHRDGILTATTLMANGDAFEDAVALAKATPALDVGCHLVLIQGRSLVTGRALPEGWTKLLQALLRRDLNPYAELRPQVEKIVAAGIRPTHFDTHKHTHVVPAVMQAVLRLAREFSVPYIRLPFDADWLPVRLPERRYRAMFTRAGVMATDHFLGFRITDSLDEAQLERTLRTMPRGSVELMCHPGYLGDELKQAATRLKETRVRELNALTSPAIRRLVEELGIQLTNYRELAGLTDESRLTRS